MSTAEPSAAASQSDTSTASQPAQESAAIGALRRRFLLAAGLGAVLVALLFLVILQSGRDGLLDHDLLGNFYDGQARALLDGHVDVDPDVPGFEGFRIGGKTHIYQGITPALARLPLLAVTDRFDGRLTGVSMLLAFCVALGYVVAAAWRTRWLIRGPSELTRVEAMCTSFAVFGIGAGSLLFLASTSWVYHEALLWGAALSLASFTHLLYWMTGRPPPGGTRPRGRLPQLVAAVVLAGLAINTRSSIGVGPIAALGMVSGCLLVASLHGAAPASGALSWVSRGTRRLTGWDTTRSTSRPGGSFAIIVVGVLAAIVLYAGVNQARFGSWFGVPLDRQVLVATDVARQRALEANDNSLFGLQYVPSVVVQILRPDALGVQSRFPYLAFPHSPPAVVGDAVFAELDWSSSVPVSEPLLFIGALLGAAVLLAPRRLLRHVAESPAERDPGTSDEHDRPVPVAALRIPVVGAALGGAAFIGFGYIAQRYLVDLYPLLVLAALVGLQAVGGWLAVRRPRPDGRLPRWPVAVVVAAVVATSLWTAWVNTALALQYSREIAPGLSEARRIAWLRTQERAGGSFDVLRIPAGTPDTAELPAPDRVGLLAIVGDCEALYRSNGTDWYLIEVGEPAGGLRLQVERTGELTGPVVLARTVPGDLDPSLGTARLVLEPLGGDQARLVVAVDRNGTVTRSLVGPTFDVPEGTPLTLDTSFDWRTDNVVVTDSGSGNELLRVQIDLPPAPIEVSSAEDLPPDVGDTTFTVAAEPLPTPACEDLIRRS